MEIEQINETKVKDYTEKLTRLITEEENIAREVEETCSEEEMIEIKLNMKRHLEKMRLRYQRDKDIAEKKIIEEKLKEIKEKK